MIKDNIEYGKIVGFKVNEKVVRGIIMSYDSHKKEYEIAITHIDGIHRPVKDSEVGYEIGLWDGPILGVV